MKKLTTFLLALLLCCSVFVACTTDNNRPESTPTDSSSIATEDSSTPDSSIVEESALDSAVKYVRALYIMDSATTAADYYVIAQAPVGDQTFDIEWSVDVTEGVAVVTESDKEGMVLIDVTRGETDVNYVLTATLTDGTDTKSVSFNRVVPAFEINTYAQYAASEKGDSLTVRGIVIGWEDKERGDSANSIYLQDLNNEGGYYLYSLSELPAGLAVGVTIEASGEFDIYSGTYELKNVSAKIIDSEANPVAPVDYTEAFINAADTKAAELVARQSMLVTLKDVTITDQDAANGYLNFTLGGKTSYLRISSSHNCITKDEQTAMKALHAEKRGFAADVTGYVAVFNGAFYLVPVDANAISNIYVPERTDAEKVAIVKDIVDLGVSGIAIPTTLSLPTSVAVHPEVSISWTAEGADVVDNKTTLTPGDADKDVKFTATITCGDVSEQVPFDITVYKTITPASPVGEVLRGLYALVNGTSLEGTYKLVGTITKINTKYSSQYNNITVTILVDGYANYPVICYRLKGDGIADLKKGDVIGVKGTLKNYNGDREFNSGCTLFDPNQNCGGCGEVGEEHAKCESCGEYTCVGDHSSCAAPEVIDTIAGALAAEDGLAVEIKGTVIKVDYNWSSSNNNMSVTISDGTDQLYIYKLATKVELYDIITVTGVVGSYKGSKQIAEGATATIDGKHEHTFENGTCTLCGAAEVVETVTTIAGALAADVGAAAVIKGIVVEINYNWSSSSNNMSVTITDGTNKLYIYQLATEVALNDIITVTGTVGNHNNANQIAEGATAVIEGQHTEHTYANGLCTACGATQPIDATLATLAYTAGTTTNMTTGNNAATVGLDASIFTVTSDKGSGNNHVGLNKAGNVRLYANNCALTVSVADGYSIVKIKLNFASTNEVSSFTVNGKALTTATSLVEINSTSFVIVNNNTSGQLHFSSIEIYYEESAGGDAPVVPSEKCECGADEIHTATCEYCGELSCVGDHSACAPAGGETPDAQPTTVPVSIADYAAANGWADGVQYSSITVDGNITATATGGGNTGKYYTSGNQWRIYQTETPSVTITAKEGYTIVSVKITYTSYKTGCLTLNGSNVASDALVSVNANSITFGVGNTGSVNNGQARITSIEVVYQAA